MEKLKCKDCPNLKRETQYTEDSFERPEKWICNYNDKKIAGHVDWNEESKIVAPDWCPLRFSAEKAVNATIDTTETENTTMNGEVEEKPNMKGRLITLSAKVLSWNRTMDLLDVDNVMLLLQNTSTMSIDISNWNDFLMMPITLSDFVACGADGKPISEATWKNKTGSKSKEYETALAAVLFEGFTLESDDTFKSGIRQISVGRDDLGLNFTFRELTNLPDNLKHVVTVDVETPYGSIAGDEFPYFVSYADLARVTLDNPIQMLK